MPVGGGPAGGGLALVEQGADLGVGEAGQVVVGDRAPLLEGQGGQRVPQVGVPFDAGAGRRAPAGPCRSGSSSVGSGARPAARSWSIALRWAIVTSQPRTLLSGRSRG